MMNKINTHFPMQRAAMRDPCPDVKVAFVALSIILGGLLGYCVAASFTVHFSAVYWGIIAGGGAFGALSSIAIQKIIYAVKYPTIHHRTVGIDPVRFGNPTRENIALIVNKVMQNQSWFQAWQRDQKYSIDDSIAYLFLMMKAGMCVGVSNAMSALFKEIKELPSEAVLQRLLDKSLLVLFFQILEIIHIELSNAKLIEEARLVLGGKVLSQQILDVQKFKTLPNITELKASIKTYFSHALIRFDRPDEKNGHALFIQLQGRFRFHDSFNDECGFYERKTKDELLETLWDHLKSYGKIERLQFIFY